MLSLYTALYSITNCIVFIICFVLFSKIYLDQLACFCTYRESSRSCSNAQSRQFKLLMYPKYGC